MMKMPNIFYLLTNQLQYLVAQPSTAWRLAFWDTFSNVGCSKSLAEILERFMKLSLMFGGLTTLVAHPLTFRTLGSNPRVHKKFCAQNLFFSLLFFSFLAHKAFLMPPFSHRLDVRMPHLLIPFKMVQDRIFTMFLSRERIKLGGCSLEFKLNLNSNANQPILIHSRHEKRRGMGLFVHGEFTRETFFSCSEWGA